MKVVTATEAQNNFGDLLMNAQSSPVSITRNGKEKGVMLSSEEYRVLKIQSLQNAITAGVTSGELTPLDMEDIKLKAKDRVKVNAKGN